MDGIEGIPRRLFAEEQVAMDDNWKAEAKRLSQARKRRKKRAPMSPEERRDRAAKLEELLKKSHAFSKILISKTKALGRVGRGVDNKVLAEANITLLPQPKIMTGGTMRDYQLEGLTWLNEIFLQVMSGILADEMGLGKTIQVISLIAHVREEWEHHGPHLIIAPLSTLSNWQDEFKKWAPSIPFAMYHGSPQERPQIFKSQLWKNYQPGHRLSDGRYEWGSGTEKFPVVCTTYEMVMKDQSSLSKIEWATVVVDEGHRMKNAESKLFACLAQFRSQSRFLITGTPLQNNLKELWSLLHFLLPKLFREWDDFDAWFNFDGLEDEMGTKEFIENKENHDLVGKIHQILQPMLLRRTKADVANYLPKKREYVLQAPMTREQTDLYKTITDKEVDTKAYLESKAIGRLTGARNSPNGSLISSLQSSRGSSTQPTEVTASPATSPAINAFTTMMRKRGRPKKTSTVASPATPIRAAAKRKVSPTSEASATKSTKSSRYSTPATSKRGLPRKVQESYELPDDSDDDKLDDVAFLEKLRKAQAKEDADSEVDQPDEEELQRARSLELAMRQVASKKLGNPEMQLRLICNSPHNFYDPWALDGEERLPVDETIVTASGKMLLLDRLLPYLFERGHKVLIFSQFKTQLDILHDYCEELRGWNVCRIDGSVAQADRREQIENFNKDPDFQVFLLSTRAGGQGINLASADTVILFDSDFNPQQDLQAQDRAHRIGQTRPVIVYRIATKGTVEERLLLRAEAKRRLEKLVVKEGAYKTMGQKLDKNQQLDKETLEALLLKDGEIYKNSGGDQILSDEDLDTICDRSDGAFARAARGAGNAAGFQVVETAEGSITQMRGTPR